MAVMCIGLVFVVWILNELVESQKSKESVPTEVPTLTLVVFFKAELVPGKSYESIPAPTLAEAQKELNKYMFLMISRALVFHKGRVCYEMNKNGVLEAV